MSIIEAAHSGEDHFVDVRNFGAVANGVADDTNAIQNAVNSLAKTGGSVLMKGDFVSGGINFPVTPQWLRIELQGTWRLKTGATLFVPNLVSINGRGGAKTLNPYARAPQAEIIPSSSAVPTLHLTGKAPNAVSNVLINGSYGPAVLISSAGAPEPSAFYTLDNVTAVAANVSTSYALKIDGSFWIDIKNSSFVAPSNAGGNVYITTTDAVPARIFTAGCPPEGCPTGLQSGLMDFEDCTVVGKGIVIAAERPVNAQGDINFEDVIHLSGTTPTFVLDSTNSVLSGITMDNVLVRSPLNVRAFIEVRGGQNAPLSNKQDLRVRNVTVKNAPMYSPLVQGGSIKGLYLYTGVPVFDSQLPDLGSQRTSETTLIQGGELVGRARIPKRNWKLRFVDSEQRDFLPALATYAFDDRGDTFWATQYIVAAPPPPHEIRIDLGAVYDIDGFRYLPRQDQYSPGGNIGRYAFYVSPDGINWGSLVATGNFPATAAEQEVMFGTVTGRFIRLVSLSEVNNGSVIVVSEIGVLGRLK